VARTLGQEAPIVRYLQHERHVQAIHAHRHTVGYRIDRVRELTGLDPMR
jgi:DNA-binding PucR family transcriptional regulator